MAHISLWLLVIGVGLLGISLLGVYLYDLDFGFFALAFLGILVALGGMAFFMEGHKKE